MFLKRITYVQRRHLSFCSLGPHMIFSFSESYVIYIHIEYIANHAQEESEQLRFSGSWGQHSKIRLLKVLGLWLGERGGKVRYHSRPGYAKLLPGFLAWTPTWRSSAAGKHRSVRISRHRLNQAKHKWLFSARVCVREGCSWAQQPHFLPPRFPTRLF